MPKRKRDEVPVDFWVRARFARTVPAGTVALPAQQPATVGGGLTVDFTTPVVGTCTRAVGVYTAGEQRIFTPFATGKRKGQLRQACDDCRVILNNRSSKHMRRFAEEGKDLRRAKRVAYEQASLGDLVDLTGGRSPPHP
jgi:hypothetical protein